MLNTSLNEIKQDLDEDLDDTVEVITTKKRKGDDGERIVVSPNAHLPVLNLAPDLKPLLFSFLTPMEAAKAALISKGFKAMANDPKVWQGYLNRYFPHISQRKPQEYDQDPKALFIMLYKCLAKLLRIQNSVDPWTPLICKLYMLDALRGKIPEREAILSNPKVKKIIARKNGSNACNSEEVISNVMQRLRVVAQANGHAVSANEELSPYNRYLTNALPAFLGNYSALDFQNPDTQEATVWGLAANGCLGDESPLNLLLINEIRRKSYDAFLIAAFGGHLRTLEFLLDPESHRAYLKCGNFLLGNAHRSSHSDTIFTALREAAREGHWHFITRLLEGNNLPDSKIVPLTVAIAGDGQLEIFKKLVERYGLSTQAKCQALKLAKTAGHQAIVSFILENFGHEFSLRNVFSHAGVVDGFKYYSSRIGEAMQIIHPLDLYEAQSMEIEPIENDLPMLNDVMPVEEATAPAPALMLSQRTARLTQEEDNTVQVQHQALIASKKKRKLNPIP